MNPWPDRLISARGTWGVAALDSIGGGEAVIKNNPTYRDAGVDIDAGAALVEAIKPMARSTARPGADAALGGFGALFDLKAAGFRDPLLVTTTDGVGTKLKLAIQCGKHDGVGIDLVAMCVNDLVVQGAEPLLFLDYYATGKLEVEAAAAIVRGIAEGCRIAGAALVGGETAEMPGLYGDGDYDLAGFSVGAVERDQVITGVDVVEGDVVIGLASSGVHSNGFSLVRKLITDNGLSLAAPAPFDGTKSLGEALLSPTRIYVKPILAVHRSVGLKALAHITGGGLIDNIPRVLPKGLASSLDGSAWTAPPVFGWLASLGVATAEMARVFNCGLGMIAVVAPEKLDATLAGFAAAGEPARRVGVITAAGDGPLVQVDGLERAWRG